MIESARAYCTQGTNPYENLALEEALMDALPLNEAALFLWRNAHCVVIGRGQNAWRECDGALLRAEGGLLARRTTGGGAVYHDLGNLNFSLLVPESEWSLPRQFGVLLAALKALGIDAALTGRNDIALTDGAKISGNAFRHHGGRALHHGTLLVRADMEKGARYLRVDPEKWKAKGVRSVQARVRNLSELRPQITTEEVASAVLVAFSREYGRSQARELTTDSLPRARMIAERLAKWEWIWGASPEGDARLQRRFAWGGLEICATVREGRATRVNVYTDAMDETLAERAQAALSGCPWQGTALAERMREIGIDDAAEWLAGAI